MDREQFEALYDAHAASLLAFLEYRCGDLELARDVHADTFERVLTTRRRHDPRRAGAKTWLYTIALNLLRDQLRRRGAEARAMERLTARVGADGPADPFAATDERDALRRALAVLSDAERDAIALRYGADLTVAEVAAVCDVPASTARGRLHHGLEKLRDELR